MMSNENLLPCPFCGGVAQRDENFGRSARTCSKCYVSIRGGLGEPDASLDDRWNRRSAPSPVVMPEGVLKALKSVDYHVEIGESFDSDNEVVLAHYIRSLSSPAPVEGLFDPARLPERDTDGEQLHPDMAAFFSDESTNSEVVKKILAGLGWEMESAEWDEESCDAADWNPEPPEPNAGWFRVGFIDSEDGLFALFVRRLSRLEREATTNNKDEA